MILDNGLLFWTNLYNTSYGPIPPRSVIIRVAESIRR